MKHQGGCHCKQFSFKTDFDPMLVVQCNCKSCRRLTGSINIGCLYADTEIDFEGETNIYDLPAAMDLSTKPIFAQNAMYVFIISQLLK